MMSDHSIGFEPADNLAKDPESVRRRFGARSSVSKFKRVAARLPPGTCSALITARSIGRRHVAFRQRCSGAIAYFVLPSDFIPDMLAVLGFTDDAAVLATAIQ